VREIVIDIPLVIEGTCVSLSGLATGSATNRRTGRAAAKIEMFLAGVTLRTSVAKGLGINA